MDCILEIKKITKSFPGVVALDDISIKVKRGEIHGLVGENGAGKSTLLKILYGVYKSDQGQIFFDSEELRDISPVTSQRKGISIIFQELNLFSTLSVAENIFVNRLMNDKNKIINWRMLNQRAEELLKSIGYAIDVKRLVSSLSIAERQMVEIAKALSFNAKLILMDEPSATLTSKELETFFSVIKKLKKQGITIIYISHKLDEIIELCDTTTVIRDGKIIDTKSTADYTKEEIIQKMVGRPVENEYPVRAVTKLGEEALRVEHLSVKNKIKDVCFSVKKGEILGIVGLVGSGRTELMRAIFGADKKLSGDIYVKGKKVTIKKPQDAIKNKIALLTEDRRGQGLFLDYDIKHNISAVDIKKILKGIFIDKKKERNVAKKYIDEIRIKCTSEDQRVLNLSGGNQQKVVVSKWMFAEPDVLIMDEPTRGIDVGAKYEIYVLMNRLTEVGKSVIFISSEIQEVLAISDRVIVLYFGKINGEFIKEEIKADQIMRCAIGQ